MSPRPSMNHFVHHWLSDPASEKHPFSHYMVTEHRPRAWIHHLHNVPNPIWGVAGPALPGRGRGYHEMNLQRQLEAYAMNTQDRLTWEEWISLSPYVRPTDNDGYTWDHNSRAGVNDGLYEEWLDVWFGHHGAAEAIELRQRVMEAVAETVNLDDVPWHMKERREQQETESRVLRCLVNDAWLASGGFMRTSVSLLKGRIWVDENHRVRIIGRSSLVWILCRSNRPTAGQEYGVRVHLEGTGRTFCIQPKAQRVHGFDLLCLYMSALADDIATSYQVSTLSPGLVVEQGLVKTPENTSDEFVAWNGGPINFSNIQRRTPPRWMSTTTWMPLTVEDFDRVR